MLSDDSKKFASRVHSILHIFWFTAIVYNSMALSFTLGTLYPRRCEDFSHYMLLLVVEKSEVFAPDSQCALLTLFRGVSEPTDKKPLIYLFLIIKKYLTCTPKTILVKNINQAFV